MMYLRCLGGLSIETEDAFISGPVGQRHRLALLALLAIAAPQGISRDKLMAYLWPERGQASARNLLNQSVHHVRRALRPDAVISEGIELRLDPEILPSDVWDFEEALEAGDWSRAQEIYGGPFLDGFHLPGAGAFHRWLDAQQLLIGEQYRDCLERLAGQAQADGDWQTSVRWWKLRLVEEPLNSRVAAALVLAMAESENLPGAIEVARRHEAFLREELGISPPDTFRQAIRQVRERPLGVGEGQHLDSGSAKASGRTADSPPSLQPPRSEQTEMPPALSPGEARATEIGPSTSLSPQARDSLEPSGTSSGLWSVPGGRRRGVAATLAMFASVAAFLYLSMGGPFSGGEGLDGGLGADGGWEAETPSVIVLPFQNLGPAEHSYRALGLSDELTHRLAGRAGLRVIGHTRAMEYDESDLQDGRVSQELGVDYALIGTVRWAQDRPGPPRVQVSPGLVRTSDGVQIWDAYYERAPEELYRIQEEVVDQVMRHLLPSSAPP